MTKIINIYREKKMFKFNYFQKIAKETQKEFFNRVTILTFTTILFSKTSKQINRNILSLFLLCLRINNGVKRFGFFKIKIGERENET